MGIKHRRAVLQATFRFLASLVSVGKSIAPKRPTFHPLERWVKAQHYEKKQRRTNLFNPSLTNSQIRLMIIVDNLKKSP